MEIVAQYALLLVMVATGASLSLAFVAAATSAAIALARAVRGPGGE